MQLRIRIHLEKNMNKILILLTIIISTSVFAQETERKRLDKNEFIKIKKIDQTASEKIGWIQENLNINWREIERNDEKLIDPNISSFEIILNSLAKKKSDKILEIVCVDCLKREYSEQKSIIENKKLKKQQAQDNLNESSVKAYKIQKDKEEKEREIAKRKRDSLNKTNTIKEEPYELLSRSLYAFSKNQNFTVFRKIDYNFAYGRLTSFLQTDMRLAEGKPTFSDTKRTHRFTPKVSDGSEFITVEFKVTKHNDLIGFYPFIDEVFVVDDVTIKGTPDLIIKFFVNYWESSFKLESSKNITGIVASKNVLSDYIILKKLKNNLLEININKGNMDVDYEKTYGINKMK